MNPLQILTETKTKEILHRYGDKAHAFLYQAKFSDKSEKELERCILYFAEIEGFQAEPIKVKANRVDNRRHYVDSVGYARTIGSVTWTKSSMQAGSADMSLTIPKKYGDEIVGVSVKVEIKIGKDYQKKNQKIYQQQIEAKKGQYWIVKTFADFYEKYHQFIKS